MIKQQIIEPNVILPKQISEHAQINLVIEGMATFLSQNMNHVLTEYDLVYIPPRELFSIKNSGCIQLRIVSIVKFSVKK